MWAKKLIKSKKRNEKKIKKSKGKKQVQKSASERKFKNRYINKPCKKDTDYRRQSDSDENIHDYLKFG